MQYVRRTASGAQVYRLPDGADQAVVMAQLRAVPGVVSVEPDIWMTPTIASPTAPPTNDTYAADMWDLMGPAQGSRYGIDAVDAWPLTTGQGVVVAVIDTGLLFNHPDLAGQSVPGYDLISDYGQTKPNGGHFPDVAGDGNGRDPDASDPGDWPRNIDDCGTDVSSWHGTHVAGTIAAIANNGLGVFGGAPGVKVQPVRVLGHCGGYMSDVIDGIYWAAGSSQVSDGGAGVLPANPYADCTTANPCVRVLNMSLGGRPGGHMRSGPGCRHPVRARPGQGRGRRRRQRRPKRELLLAGQLPGRLCRGGYERERQARIVLRLRLGEVPAGRHRGTGRGCAEHHQRQRQGPIEHLQRHDLLLRALGRLQLRLLRWDVDGRAARLTDRCAGGGREPRAHARRNRGHPALHGPAVPLFGRPALVLACVTTVWRGHREYRRGGGGSRAAGDRTGCARERCRVGRHGRDRGGLGRAGQGRGQRDHGL